jgi:hypothetical protein
MQIKLPPKNIEKMLKNAECEISYRSKNKLKRQRVNYVLKERYYWLANIHFERGTRPQRLFESKEVIKFIKKHVEPYIQ